jgi:hypothetical protein
MELLLSLNRDSNPGRDIVQAGSGAHTAHYSMVTEGSYPGVKRQGRETDNSTPSSAEVKNDGAIPPLHHTSS